MDAKVLNRKLFWIAMLVTSVFLCFVQENEAAVSEDENILEDAILLPARSRHTRHVRKANRFSPSVSPPIMDMELSTIPQQRSQQNDSEEINFSEEDDSTSISILEPNTSHSGKIDNQPSEPSNTSQFEQTNSSSSSSSSSSIPSFGIVDSSEFPSQSKIEQNDVNSHKQPVVVINENTDRVKIDGNESQGSSKLWIYSNVVCIILVIGVSIFLIYYPKKNGKNKGTCTNSTQSSTESSTSTSSTNSTA